MITGVNTHFPWNGTDYHIQIEDLDASFEFEVRVYIGGAVVFQKRQSYRSAFDSQSKDQPIEATLQTEMGKLLGLVKAAIQKGRIGAQG